ncbi:MAG: sigma-70 family RNA polymerase sigma factor [Rikenellaceae bacterium]|nr:sigma-70 family RNA polymerase sigma factor [Rikenellaceae bacterium]
MRFSTEETQTLSDDRLLELFRQTGRTEYLGQLYNRYVPLVYGLSLKYLKDADSAQDTVLQIFELLLHKVDRIEIKEFRSWLYSVAKNHCLQLLRKSNREVATDFSGKLMESGPQMHLFEKEEDEKKLAALEKCMERLPVPQRESVRLFFLEEKSYAEVAEWTAYPLKSVKSYIQNGKRNLKICLEKQGISV